MTAEDRRKGMSIMLAPLINDAAGSQSIFNIFLDIFPEFARQCGSKVGHSVLNPAKLKNKPGRKRKQRFLSQHDYINGKKKK
jgi:hypothetical protein